jgi:hypothetical protein
VADLSIFEETTMQTYWNPWSVFDELERTFFHTASSSEWPQFERIANGELSIRLEKATNAKPRRIKLTSGLASKVKGLLTSDKKEKTAA